MTPREAIARALCTADDGGDTDLIFEREFHSGDCTNDAWTCAVCQQNHYRALAGAAIAALKSSGYRVVPEEPTEAMVAKALDVWLAKVIEDSGSNGAEAKSSVPVIYRAMLSAMENSE